MSMLMLHPIGLDQGCWRWLPIGGMRCLDFPGHSSEPAADDVSLPALARFVAAKIDGPADLVGVSLGGIVAQHVAITRPDLVRSLVLACCTANTDRKVLLERARQTERRGTGFDVDETIGRWFSTEADGAAVAEQCAYVRRCLRRGGAEVVARYWRSLADHDVRDRLYRVTAPTTVVCGNRDRSSQRSSVIELADLLPDARLVTLDAGHLVHLERPAEFADVLRAHMDRVAA